MNEKTSYVARMLGNFNRRLFDAWLKRLDSLPARLLVGIQYTGIGSRPALRQEIDAANWWSMESLSSVSKVAARS